MTITDLYIRLFGKTHIRDGDVIEMAEHGRTGGISTGQGFKYQKGIDLALKYVQDGQDVYIAEAKVGSSLADPVWQAYKFTASDGTITYANGNENYTNPANDLTALSYE